MAGPPPHPRRASARGRRAAPLLALAMLAVVAGAVVGARHSPQDQLVAQSFVRAWEREDYAAMHALISPGARRRTGAARFAAAYRRVAATATLVRVRAGRAGERRDGVVTVSMTVSTRIFGAIAGTLKLAMEDEDGAPRVDWAPHLAFPGLEPAEALRRSTKLPPRADILARDGRPLARGPDRTSALGPLGLVAGTLGPAPPEARARLFALGLESDARIGVSGLERELEPSLRGTPGGELRAGGRLLARSAPRPAAATRASLDVEVQQAAVQALAGRLGGVAVLRPRTGEVLALAGIAFSAPQPPGSTFKVVTLAAALEAGLVDRGSTFPAVTATRLEGVELENADGELCGGTLAEAFAESCNSVFAPLGAQLGARRLVAAAERFGFNEAPTLQGAAPSTIPPAAEIGGDLAVGSTAIGQGRLLATPVQMASVAATIARRGRRVRPTLLAGASGRSTVVTSAKVARTTTRLMERVVRSGTGTAAALPGVRVAGKTGTAELRDTTRRGSEDPGTPPGEERVQDRTDTDAWFIAFAPAQRPRVAVAVLLVGQGAGGETAAPAARIVLQAALGRGG